MRQNVQQIDKLSISLYMTSKVYHSYDYLDEDDRQNGFPLFPLFCKQLSGQMQNAEETFDYDKEYQDTQKLQYCYQSYIFFS